MSVKELIEQTNSLLGKKRLNVLDLFCGCGGMSKGLEEAGFNIIAGIDCWDKAIESYSKNFNHLSLCKNLTEYPPSEFKKICKKKVHIIVGGPPCQSYSIAGKRDPNDPRASLFVEYVKYLDYFQPDAFIMENVLGILTVKTGGGDKVIDIIMGELERNYECVICKLMASDFCVPQNRRRVIIFGLHKRLGKTPVKLEPILNPDDRIPVSTIILPKEQIDDSFFLSKKAIDGIKAKREKSKQEGKGFGAQFLDMDKPSYTIPARYWKDGYDALVKYSENSIRRLTILELKRIQSFPDDYELCGSKKDVIMQIGNAVACKFAYYLGLHLKSMIYN